MPMQWRCGWSTLALLAALALSTRAMADGEPLPPVGTPLAEIVDELTWRTARGEPEAACRLAIQLDSDSAMKLVSIRLPIPLIDSLKAIAGHHGVAYQPMIRDLLMRFARSEFLQIHAEINGRMEAAQSIDESSPPVEAFIERTRKTAGG